MNDSDSDFNDPSNSTQGNMVNPYLDFDSDVAVDDEHSLVIRGFPEVAFVPGDYIRIHDALAAVPKDPQTKYAAYRGGIVRLILQDSSPATCVMETIRYDGPGIFDIIVMVNGNEIVNLIDCSFAFEQDDYFQLSFWKNMNLRYAYLCTDMHKHRNFQAYTV